MSKWQSWDSKDIWLQNYMEMEKGSQILNLTSLEIEVKNSYY
jgi:hypothetical protein